MRVLVIEDDPTTSETIQLILRSEGYVVHGADLGEEGIELARLYEHDIIVLDLMLPDIDGYQVLNRLRNSRVRTPVLVLSGLAELEDKLKALGIGADDYLTKPFDRRELVARISAIVRRANGYADPVINVGRMSIDLNGRFARSENGPIPLTAKEFSILELLALRKGKTVSKAAILDHLYGGIDEPEMKTVDVFVCKLRAKIAEACNGDNYIVTSRAQGYRLTEPNAEAVA